VGSSAGGATAELGKGPKKEIRTRGRGDSSYVLSVLGHWGLVDNNEIIERKTENTECAYK
jgi:hypothetical protein